MMISTISGCDEKTAREAYLKHNNNAILAIDSILFAGKDMPHPLKRQREDINEHEDHLNKLRKTMEAIDNNISQHRSTTANPLADAEPAETPDPPAETVQQSNCLPEYQLSLMGVMGQTQGTVCR